jgi:hypothetical protein
MKNFKKLFIALPLVLVMLFAALPVFAENVNTYKVSVGNITVDLELDKDANYEYLHGKNAKYPVWAAVNSTWADKDMTAESTGYIKMLNKGNPVGWVEANPDAVTELQIGQYAVQNLAFFKDNGYFLPTYNINHVIKVNTEIEVPENWIEGYEAKAAYKFAEGYDKLAEKDEEVVAPKFELKDGVYTVDGKAVEVTTKADPVMSEVKATLAKVDGVDPAEYVVAYDQNSAKFDEVKEGPGYTEEYLKEYFETVDVTGLKAEGKVQTGTNFKTFVAKDVFKYAVGDDATELVENVYTTTDKKTYGTFKGTKDLVQLTKGTAPVQFKAATITGVLVVVEEQSVPVTVKHHYMVADGEEIVKETKEVQDKNVVLTANNILQSWLMPVGSYVYDPAQTKVEAVKEDKTLINGEVFVTGYVVDLFYTAAEGEESDIEAAFANTTAGVANQQNVANLPATGAASNVAVILSSVALVVVGLFLKK